MSRGGHRENAGRKSGWSDNDTQTIRIPKRLTRKILDYAHTIDNGEDYKRQIILAALNHYIEAQQQESGANQHRRKGEPLNIKESRDWKHFVRFMREIEGND